MRTVDAAGIEVGAATREAWLDALAAAARGPGPHHHVSLNAAKWVAMRRDAELRAAVRSASSVAADGVGIVLATRWLGDPVPERVPGFDLAVGLVERARREEWRVYLLGGRQAVVERVARDLRASGVDVVGARDGWFEAGDERGVVDGVRATAPHVLLLALGTPKAELFAARWAPELGSGLILGVGGTFDVWAGQARRAPGWAQRAGLEWAWRFASEPRGRFQRAIVDSARFAAAIARGLRVPP